jgi:hypothetical protein
MPNGTLNIWLLDGRRVSPGDKLACRFTNGARSRCKTYRHSDPKGRWISRILHTCDEPAFIFSELTDPAAFDMATEPNFGKDELDIDKRRLFTVSITDRFRQDGAAPKCCSYVDSFSFYSQTNTCSTKDVSHLPYPAGRRLH